jgi:hypothetical protein
MFRGCAFAFTGFRRSSSLISLSTIAWRGTTHARETTVEMTTSNAWNPDVNLDSVASVAVLGAAVLSILIAAATAHGDDARQGVQAAQNARIGSRVAECPGWVPASTEIPAIPAGSSRSRSPSAAPRART